MSGNVHKVCYMHYLMNVYSHRHKYFYHDWKEIKTFHDLPSFIRTILAYVEIYFSYLFLLLLLLLLLTIIIIIIIIIIVVVTISVVSIIII